MTACKSHDLEALIRSLAMGMRADVEQPCRMVPSIHRTTTISPDARARMREQSAAAPFSRSGRMISHSSSPLLSLSPDEENGCDWPAAFSERRAESGSPGRGEDCAEVWGCAMRIRVRGALRRFEAEVWQPT
jgi:hypothetical protein